MHSAFELSSLDSGILECLVSPAGWYPIPLLSYLVRISAGDVLKAECFSAHKGASVGGIMLLEK